MVTVAGHRGLPLSYPDNTLEGIVAASEVADMVELDVRRTADGVLVLSHDPAIAGHDVATSDWETLRDVDVGDGYHPTRLEAVLEALPDLPLDIEVKNSPLETGFDPDDRHALAAAALARPIDVVTCFHWPTMARVREAHPEVATGLLVDPRLTVAAAVEEATRRGHQLIAPHFSLLADPAAIAGALAAGLALATWTVNDIHEAIRLAHAGVGTIISDDPESIRAAVTAIGEPDRGTESS